MTFEDFLHRKAQSVSMSPIKSEADFNIWLGHRDIQDILDYAEEWGKEVARETRAMVEEEHQRKL